MLLHDAVYVHGKLVFFVDGFLVFMMAILATKFVLRCLWQPHLCDRKAIHPEIEYYIL